MSLHRSMIYAAAAMSLGIGLLAPTPPIPRTKPKRYRRTRPVKQADRSRKVHLIKGVRP